MAKPYSKPSIAFQPLTMGMDLSAGCAFKSLFAEFICPIMIEEWGETIFTENVCDWSNDDFYVCYHVPTATLNVFGS